MSKFLLFRNSTTSYVNSFENFRGAEVGSGTIKLYFKGLKGNTVTGNTDEVLVSATSGMEYIALKDLLSLREKATKTLLVAVDHTNLKESIAHINALTSVTVADRITVVGATTEVVTSNRSLAVTDDHNTFLMNTGGAQTFTLPLMSTLHTGWNCKIINIGSMSSGNMLISKANTNSNCLTVRCYETKRDTEAYAAAPIIGTVGGDDSLWLESVHPGTGGNSYKFISTHRTTDTAPAFSINNANMVNLDIDIDSASNTNNTAAKIIESFESNSTYLNHRIRSIVRLVSKGSPGNVTSNVSLTDFTGGVSHGGNMVSTDNVPKNSIVYSHSHDSVGDEFNIYYNGTLFIIKAFVHSDSGITFL